jgi:hypothetical protein
MLTRVMLAVVKGEQGEEGNPKLLSSVLWDMFTGNERYKNVFRTALRLPVHIDTWRFLGRNLARRGS